MDSVVKFNIESIANYSGDDNPEFAVMRLNFLSDGHNQHGIPITTELLKKYAPTILGKPIVARYDKTTRDVEGHETDEVIVGYIPTNAEITYEETDNGLFACVDGLISKLYATDVYEIYKTKNYRAVSIEFLTNWSSENENELESFNITGVTLLGLKYNPSCTLASSKIVQFSIDQANALYDDYIQDSELFAFADKKKAKMEGKTYKINTEELKETPWGDVDKTKLRNVIMSASNRANLVKKVYLKIESGWEESPSSKLQYPVMELVGDTFYYNRYALSSAMAYAKQNNETEVISKLNKLYKQFDLIDDSKGSENKKMSTKKFEIEGREAWGDVIKQVQSHEGDKAYVDSIEKDHIIYTIDNVRYRVEADVEVGEDDKTVHATIKWNTKKKDADQKMATKEKMDDDIDDDDDDDDNKPKEGQMSSDGNVDPSAIATNREKEAKVNKELAEQLKAKEDIIMGQEQELQELREFKANIEKQQIQQEVAETMDEVVGLIDKEMCDTLKEEGLKCTMESLTAWKNKVKAEAFDKASQKKAQSQKFSGGIWRMASPHNDIDDKSKSKSIWESAQQ